jgi:hypothetical protein
VPVTSTGTPSCFIRSENAAKLDIVEELVELASDLGCSLPELAARDQRLQPRRCLAPAGTGRRGTAATAARRARRGLTTLP